PGAGVQQRFVNSHFQYTIYSDNASGAPLPVAQFVGAAGGRPIFFVSKVESAPGSGILGVSYQASIPAFDDPPNFVTYPAAENDFDITTNIPEPSTTALLGSALVGLRLFFGRRRSNRK